MIESDIRERRLQFLIEIASLPTAPGAEEAVARWISDFAETRGLNAKVDRWCNLLVHYRIGPEVERPFAFCAHMDHPGFRAVRMTGDRAVSARFYGRVPAAMLARGARMRFFSGDRWIRAEIAEDTIGERDETGGISVSIRLEEAADIAPDRPGMWDFPDAEMRPADDGSNAKLVFARGHDDLALVAAIASLIDHAVDSGAEGEFYALFTRAEENGFLGAIGACGDQALPKRCVPVALEASKALANAPVGGGAIVRVGDVMSIFTPWVSAWLWDTAKSIMSRDPSLRFQRRLMDGGTCETTVYNAWGYEAGGLCLPLGNYHNITPESDQAAPEYIAPDDFIALTSLMSELAFNSAPAASDHMRKWLEELFDRRSGMLGGEVI